MNGRVPAVMAFTVLATAALASCSSSGSGEEGQVDAHVSGVTTTESPAAANATPADPRCTFPAASNPGYDEIRSLWPTFTDQFREYYQIIGGNPDFAMGPGTLFALNNAAIDEPYAQEVIDNIPDGGIDAARGLVCTNLLAGLGLGGERENQLIEFFRDNPYYVIFDNGLRSCSSAPSAGEVPDGAVVGETGPLCPKAGG